MDVPRDRAGALAASDPEALLLLGASTTDLTAPAVECVAQSSLSPLHFGGAPSSTIYANNVILPEGWSVSVSSMRRSCFTIG